MILFISILTLLPVFLFSIFIPYLTRRTESFGISIPESIYYSSELQELRKKYVVITSTFSLIILLTFILLNNFYILDENGLGILLTIIISVYLIGGFVIYLKFHFDMKQRKAKSNWIQDKSELVVIDTSFRESQITYSNLWYGVPFAITIITAIFTLKFYHVIPSKVPMQYDFSGNITNSANKSYRTVMTFPVLQAYMTLLFIFINVIIAKSKQQINAENPEKSMMQNITFRRRWSAFMLITGTLMVLMFGMIQFSFIFTINQTLLVIISLLITAGIVIGAIVLSITTGQGGSRVGSYTDKGGSIVDRDDDKYWKLGQFYFNKNDPSIFLEKRFGVGWTNNWARPVSWLLLIAIIGVAVGIPLLLIR